MKAPVPSNEVERLKALRAYEVLDTNAEQDFDDITLLASQVAGTPIALIQHRAPRTSRSRGASHKLAGSSGSKFWTISWWRTASTPACKSFVDQSTPRAITTAAQASATCRTGLRLTETQMPASQPGPR
jgi:hypothetical protein